MLQIGLLGVATTYVTNGADFGLPNFFYYAGPFDFTTDTSNDTLTSVSRFPHIVIDPDVPWVLDRDELKSKCRNTPFDEARCRDAPPEPSSRAGRYTNTCDGLKPPGVGAEAMSYQAYAIAAFAVGYLLGSIPFGLMLTKLVGLGRHPRGRLGQHRRDQRAAHRP